MRSFIICTINLILSGELNEDEMARHFTCTKGKEEFQLGKLKRGVERPAYILLHVGFPWWHDLCTL
jgi:hypothetical protein